MEILSSVIEMVEWVMGTFLFICVILGFLSVFGPADTNRYNGAGTTDQNDSERE